LWLIQLSEWFLGERTSTETVAEVHKRFSIHHKLMAQAGIASRADVDEMLSDSENGIIATSSQLN